MTKVGRGVLTVAAAGVLCAAARDAHAIARLWTGATNSNWSNAANWLPPGTPGPTDDVTITGGSATINIDAAADVNSVTVNGACTRTIRAYPATTPIRVRGNLTLAATSGGGTFRLGTGTTQIGGQLTRSNGNLTLDTNGGVIIFNAAAGSLTHTLSGATVDTVIFNDGLVGYWTLEEAASPFADSSGYANDASLTGTYAAATPPTLLFSDAKGVAFNGTSNVLALGTTNLPAANAPQTISVWLKFSGASSSQGIVSLTGASSAVKLVLEAGYVRVRKNSGATLVQVTAPSTNTWHHVAYSLSGTTHVLYVDGVATTATATPDSATPTAAFAGATGAGTERLTGALDDLRVYSRALGPAEVLALAQGRQPGTGVATHTLADAFANAASASQFIIASGIVTGSSTISAHGDWLNYGGRFTGTGTVTLTAGAARTLLTGEQPFRNLTIDASGSYTLADRLWVSEVPGVAGTGVLALAQSGALDGGGHVMHVGKLDDQTKSGGGFVSTTDGTLVLDGSSTYPLASKNFCGLRIEDPTESGLVGYWKLDQGVGTAVRESINNNEGTVSPSGAAWAAASTTIGFDNPSAMTFTGASSGYVSASAVGLPAANAAQTLSLWVKFSSAAATQSLLSMNAGAGALRVGLGNGKVQVLNLAGGVLAQVTAPSADAWHHIAYVYDPSQSAPANRDRIYVDGSASTGTAVAHDTTTPTVTFMGASSLSADYFTGSLDDVRVYNVALTATQVTSLSLGRYAGTGGVAALTLAGGDTTIPTSASSGCNGGMGYGLALDSGSLYTSNLKLTVRLTSSPVLVNAGTLHIGSDVFNGDGGVTVNPMGTLLMDEAGGQLQPGKNSTVIIDGTLIASNAAAIIQRDNNGERYAFMVGSSASARPVLNITGLAIRDTDANGLHINADPGAVTTFTRFDNIAFRRGTGTFLSIYSPSLHLTSNGFSFGIGDSGGALPANNAVVTGNGIADGETRVVFGTLTCHTSKMTSGNCQNTWKLDDDADGNGVPDHPASNGAVVQYIRSAATDTTGTIEGFPTAAFDWNTFTHYATYVAFHDASGTADRVYVRDDSGNAEYYWDTPSGETIVGTPRWLTSGTAHVVFVATASGNVYRLIDSGSSLTPDSSGAWATPNNPFACGCTIVTPLGYDTSNLYWGGVTSAPATQKVWTLGQTSRAQPTGSPLTITPTLTSASPVLWTSGATHYAFMGMSGNIIKVNLSNQTVDATNINPGSATVYGRIGIGGTTRVFAGDDGGSFWAIDPTNFAGTSRVWQYAVSGDSIKGFPYYDSGTAVVHFGTELGKIVALNSSGVALTGYPLTPGSTSDAIRAVLYVNGILAFGTTTGKLYFYDRNNGTTGPALINEYDFGPTEMVSAVAFDSSTSRYMVSTADPTTMDGRLYFFDQLTDPTSAK